MTFVSISSRYRTQRASRRWFRPLVAALLCLHVGLAAAHHASAIYDAKKRVNVNGTVTRVAWTNPHGYVHLDHKTADGQLEKWVFELHDIHSMLRSGWNKGTLKPGDIVTVRAIPERSGAPRAFMLDLTFPDGRKVVMRFTGFAGEE